MKSHLGAAIVVAALAFTLSACSDTNPVGPAGQTQMTADLTATGEPVQLWARIQTTDQNRRMLTLAGKSDTVIAAHNCEIVRLKNGNESPVPFTDVGPSDSVGIWGNRQQNGYVLAMRIQICGDSCWDLSFRDTILTIDYEAGFFTVAGRSEAIYVDENTILWSNIVQRKATFRDRYAHQEMVMAAPAGFGPGYQIFRRDTSLVFTDLEVGDIVEVKANTVDESTLLAVAIKLTNCADMEARCVHFEATIATLDVDARTVTFEGLAWNGVVCKGAKLLDVEGFEITLADFAPGELVDVKGVPGEDDVLKICFMQKL